MLDFFCVICNKLLHVSSSMGLVLVIRNSFAMFCFLCACGIVFMKLKMDNK